MWYSNYLGNIGSLNDLAVTEQTVNEHSQTLTGCLRLGNKMRLIALCLTLAFLDAKLNKISMN